MAHCSILRFDMIVIVMTMRIIIILLCIMDRMRSFTHSLTHSFMYWTCVYCSSLFLLCVKYVHY